MIQAGAADPVGWAARRLAECGVEAPRLEAQLLLALALGITRTAVTAGLFECLGSAESARFQDLVESRYGRAPLAYLRGTQEFYGLDFEVGPAVLIPRPETEMLVDFALEKLAEGRSNRSLAFPPILADVGTGSGCIAIAALAHCPQAVGVAFELSASALEIARRNAVRHTVADRLRFVRSDLLCGAAADRFDLILSNPPYIPTGELAGLQPEVRDFEPRLALEGGTDGLAPYRRLAPMAQHCLAPGGSIAVEVGQGQAPDVARIFADAGLSEIEVRRDLAGIERLVAAQHNLP